ncbi:MAG TPA: hypothetical protein V6D25_06165, partial [Leptolyngbyaceae cyanobacterium]
MESKTAIKHFPVQQEVIDSNNKFYQLRSNFSTNGSCSYAPVYHEIGEWGVGGDEGDEGVGGDEGAGEN